MSIGPNANKICDAIKWCIHKIATTFWRQQHTRTTPIERCKWPSKCCEMNFLAQWQWIDIDCVTGRQASQFDTANLFSFFFMFRFRVFFLLFFFFLFILFLRVSCFSIKLTISHIRLYMNGIYAIFFAPADTRWHSTDILGINKKPKSMPKRNPFGKWTWKIKFDLNRNWGLVERQRTVDENQPLVRIVD